MNFFTTIKDSIYNPSFYRQLPKKTFSSALMYYLLLCLLVTLLRVISLGFPLSMAVHQLINTVPGDIINSYPQDLTISIHNGQVTTNVEEPYFIPLKTLDNHKNFLVIDTHTPFSQKQFDAYDSYVWITKDTVFYKGDSNSQIRAYDLSSANNFTLNRGVIQDFIHGISPWLVYITPALIVFLFIALYFGYLFYLIYLLLLAFIFWLIAKKLLPGLSYGNGYKVALHAVTLGFIIAAIIQMLNSFTHVYTFPFMQTILATAVFIGNYWNTSNVKKAPAHRRVRKKV